MATAYPALAALWPMPWLKEPALRMRLPVPPAILVRMQGHRSCAAHLFELSPQDCVLLDLPGVVAGTRLGVMVPGFRERDARIEGVAAGGLFCRFATPLPMAVFDHIIRMADPAARG